MGSKRKELWEFISCTVWTRWSQRSWAHWQMEEIKMWHFLLWQTSAPLPPLHNHTHRLRLLSGGNLQLLLVVDLLPALTNHSFNSFHEEEVEVKRRKWWEQSFFHCGRRCSAPTTGVTVLCHRSWRVSELNVMCSHCSADYLRGSNTSWVGEEIPGNINLTRLALLTF